MESDFALVELLRDSTDLIIRYALDGLVALALLIGGFLLGRWAQRRTEAHLQRYQRVDPTLRPLLGRVAKLVVFVLVLVAVLAQFGVQTSSIIALIGATGLALGLAFKDTLSNVASGLLLLMMRPFNVGDWVELGDESGRVLEIGLFFTKLRSPDGHHITLPNSVVANDAMENLSRDELRRMVFEVGVGYGDDLDQCEQVLLEAIGEDERLRQDPAPQVFVSSLGDSAVVFTVRAWAEQSDYWPARFALLKRIKQRLDQAGIQIPFPQSDVHLIDGKLRVASSDAASNDADAAEADSDQVDRRETRAASG